jgi:chromosomal replication initiator protein
MTEQGLSVVVGSSFYASWLQAKFGAALREAARSETGSGELELAWKVDAGRFEKSAPVLAIGGSGAAVVMPSGGVAVAAPAPRPDRPRPKRSGDGPALRHRFGEFVVGSSNRLAFDAATRIARGDASVPMLFIHGECGVGKTHLLQSVAAEWLESRPGTRVRYITGEAFTNEYVAAVQARRVEPLRAALRRLDLLCIDDVHFLSGKVATQTEFLHTFDALLHAGARVALASDHHPREIEKLNEHLVSRCLGGAVVRIDRPDSETRRGIIRRIAAQRGVMLDEAGVASVAGSCTGSVREIEGAIARVQAMSRLLVEASNGSASIAPVVVQSALASPQRRLTRPVRVLTIAEIVCRELGVDMSELLGRGRHKRVVLARSLTAYLARTCTTQSYPEIARELNRPNHSTIVTAFQRIKKQIEENQPFADDPSLGVLALGDLCERLRAAVKAAAQPV